MLASRTFSGSLTLEWDATGPWAAPHSGFVVSLDKAAATMLTRVMVTPMHYTAAIGPDRPWEWH